MSLLSILLSGDSECGKTALACRIAMESQFPFIKVLSPEILVNKYEAGKENAITKVFEDAYKSPLSMVILDNLERLIEFIKIGPRFSNNILQKLLVFIKQYPKKKGHKIVVIGTTSLRHILNELELVSVFNVKLDIPNVCEELEFRNVLNTYQGSDEDKNNVSISIKYLLRL